MTYRERVVEIVAANPGITPARATELLGSPASDGLNHGFRIKRFTRQRIRTTFRRSRFSWSYTINPLYHEKPPRPRTHNLYRPSAPTSGAVTMG
jgi:hypothetical protein